jgi:RNA polymerase sigma factor (TIGR02999 family)
VLNRWDSLFAEQQRQTVIDFETKMREFAIPNGFQSFRTNALHGLLAHLASRGEPPRDLALQRHVKDYEDALGARYGGSHQAALRESQVPMLEEQVLSFLNDRLRKTTLRSAYENARANFCDPLPHHLRRAKEADDALLNGDLKRQDVWDTVAGQPHSGKAGQGYAGVRGVAIRDREGYASFVSDVTQILSAIAAGQPQAADQLLPLVYAELRQLAAQRLAQEKPGQTLDATALVHETYLRLVGDQHFANRGHFFAAAAEAMRRILLNRARDKNRRKRGGGRSRVDLDHIEIALDTDDDQLIALDDALTQLGGEDADAAQLVHLRFFAGLTLKDAAAAMGLAQRTAERQWAYARAWLYARLRPDDGA